MDDERLQRAFGELGNYIAGRAPEGWRDVALELAFVDDDVVESHGEVHGATGEAVPLALDFGLVALVDEIREALGDPYRDEVAGLSLALKSDGALSIEFIYVDDE